MLQPDKIATQRGRWGDVGDWGCIRHAQLLQSLVKERETDANIEGHHTTGYDHIIYCEGIVSREFAEDYLTKIGVVSKFNFFILTCLARKHYFIYIIKI